MRVLIVDDELVSRNKMLKIRGNLADCVAVDSGKAALKAFSEAWEIQEPFDLATLDISMPGKDGTEVLHEIREIEKTEKIPKEKHIKILMVTSLSDKDTIISCIKAECNGYIVKPFNKEIVLEKIKKLNLL